VQQAVDEVHANEHHGKVGVLCLASEGRGVTDPETRARHENAINRFRAAGRSAPAERE
jgi:crotonyl-CoA reductase